MPPRLSQFSPASFTLIVAVGAVILVSIGDVAPSLDRLANGLPRMVDLIGRMMPPNTEAEFLTRIFWRIIETFQIALVGTFLGS